MGHTEAVGPSKALARQVYQKRKNEVREGRFFPELTRRGVLLSELLDDAIRKAREERLRPGNRYKILARWFAGRTAASITSDEIGKRLAAERVATGPRKGQPLAAATFNHYRVALSHAYKIGIENKKVTENPARGVKLFKLNNERIRFLNDVDALEERKLRAAMAKQCPAREAEFDLALHTGMRWAEQYSLQWENVSLERKQITLLLTKSGKRQVVRLNSAAVAALVKLGPKETGIVCPDGDDEWAHRTWWDSVRRAAKISDFHWHDLRHTFASRLVMNGVDIYKVSKLLRHGSVKVTERYAHLADVHLADAVERSVTASVTAPRDGVASATPTIH